MNAVPQSAQGDNDDYELHLIYCIYLLVVLTNIIDGFGLFMMGGFLHIYKLEGRKDVLRSLKRGTNLPDRFTQGRICDSRRA